MKNHRSEWAIVGLAAMGAVAIAHTALAAPSPFGIVAPESGGSPIGGPLSPLFLTIALYQQQFYMTLLSAIETLRSDPRSVWVLMGVSFVYGIFHAAGPGHGKAVISGYVVAKGESVRRGVVLSFISAFVQAITAVLVVAIAGGILRVTAVTMTTATNWFEVASYALIVLVGLWLLWSKTLGGHHHAHFHAPLPAGADAVHDHDDHAHDHHHHEHEHAHHAHAAHDHDDHDDHGHDHDEDDDHAHDFAAVAKAAAIPGESPIYRAWSAILAVGIRPCSGALLVLVFTLSQGVFLAGIAATFVMALGTGLTVAILATLAVSARGLALRLAGTDSRWSERLVHSAEIAVAVAVLIFGLLMLGGSFATGLPGSA